MLDQIKYLFQFKSSFIYKMWYIYSSLLKLYRLKLLWKFNFTNFPFRWDFIIENLLWKFKIYEPSDMHSVLNPNSEKELYRYFKLDWWIFLDIWTNVWKYSVYVWRQNKNNKVYSFEPNTFLFNNYLLENIKLNSLNNINLNNIWLSNQEWEFDLFVPENNFWSWSIENHYDNWKKYTIKLEKLDDYLSKNKIDIKNIKLIKIDVEWHEYKLLKWACNTLKNVGKCRLIIEIFSNNQDYQETINFIISLWFKLIDKLYWDNYIFYKN